METVSRLYSGTLRDRLLLLHEIARQRIEVVKVPALDGTESLALRCARVIIKHAPAQAIAAVRKELLRDEMTRLVNHTLTRMRSHGRNFLLHATVVLFHVHLSDIPYKWNLERGTKSIQVANGRTLSFERTCYEINGVPVPYPARPFAGRTLGRYVSLSAFLDETLPVLLKVARIVDAFKRGEI